MLLLFFAGETPGGRKMRRFTDKCKACAQRRLLKRTTGKNKVSLLAPLTLSTVAHVARGSVATVRRQSKAVAARVSSVRVSVRASVRVSATRASDVLVRASDVARASVVRRSSQPPLRVPPLRSSPEAPGRRGSVVRDGAGRRRSCGTVHTPRAVAMRRSIADAGARTPRAVAMRRSIADAAVHEPRSPGSPSPTSKLGASGNTVVDDATLSSDEDEETQDVGKVGGKRGAKGKAGGEGGLSRLAQAKVDGGESRPPSPSPGGTPASLAVYAALQRGVVWRRQQTKEHAEHAAASPAAAGPAAPPKRARRGSVAAAARGAAHSAATGTQEAARAAAMAAAGMAVGFSPLPSPPSSPSEMISDEISDEISYELSEAALERLLSALDFSRSVNAARSESTHGLAELNRARPQASAGRACEPASGGSHTKAPEA